MRLVILYYTKVEFFEYLIRLYFFLFLYSIWRLVKRMVSRVEGRAVDIERDKKCLIDIVE